MVWSQGGFLTTHTDTKLVILVLLVVLIFIILCLNYLTCIFSQRGINNFYKIYVSLLLVKRIFRIRFDLVEFESEQGPYLQIYDLRIKLDSSLAQKE